MRRLAGWIGGVCCLLMWWLAWPAVQARPLAQAPVVSTADVSTPTPTPVRTPALPTPTPVVAAASVPVLTPDAPHGWDQPRTYTVQGGDTVWSVALEVGLDLDDMACAIAPDFTSDQPLVIGNQLEIPPANVLCHAVQAGETLVSIAAQYGVTPEQIYHLPWNRLAGQPLAAVQLVPGTHLRIPLTPDDGAAGGQSMNRSSKDFLPWMLSQSIDTSPYVAFAVGGPGRAVAPANNPSAVPPDWLYGSGHFVWPLHGWLTQGYRYDHRAIDIGAAFGTPVVAADRGVVVRAGWNDQGYGLFVVIDHNIDYVTLYAHLSQILVKEGDVVAQGQVIGKVGSTGNSTGPHLHFEIRDFGRLTNPLELLER